MQELSGRMDKLRVRLEESQARESQAVEQLQRSGEHAISPLRTHCYSWIGTSLTLSQPSFNTSIRLMMGFFILDVNIKYIVCSILYRHINVPMACKELIIYCCLLFLLILSYCKQTIRMCE